MKGQHQLPLAWLHLGRNWSSSSHLFACVLPGPRDTGSSECPFQLRRGLPREPADFYHDCAPPCSIISLGKAVLVRVGWDPPTSPHPLCSMSSLLPSQACRPHLCHCPRSQAGSGKELGLRRGQNHLPALLSDSTFWGHLGARRAGCGASLHDGKMKRWGLGRRKDRELREERRGLGAEQEYSGVN